MTRTHHAVWYFGSPHLLSTAIMIVPTGEGVARVQLNAIVLRYEHRDPGTRGTTPGGTWHNAWPRPGRVQCDRTLVRAATGWSLVTQGRRYTQLHSCTRAALEQGVLQPYKCCVGLNIRHHASRQGASRRCTADTQLVRNCTTSHNPRHDWTSAHEAHSTAGVRRHAGVDHYRVKIIRTRAIQATKPYTGTLRASHPRSHDGLIGLGPPAVCPCPRTRHSCVCALQLRRAASQKNRTASPYSGALPSQRTPHHFHTLLSSQPQGQHSAASVHTESSYLHLANLSASMLSQSLRQSCIPSVRVTLAAAQ